MNHRCISFVSSLFLLIATTGFAQQDSVYSPAFYNYLKQQNLYSEQITYLNAVQSACTNTVCADTLFLTKALCFQALQDTVNCRRMTDSIKFISSFTETSLREKYVSLLFLQKKWTVLEKNLSINDTGLFNRQAKIYLQILRRAKITELPADTLLMNEHPLSEIVQKYKHPLHRSALAAGLLSAVVPGLGKLYAGYKYQALSAFTTNIFFAAQTVEALLRSGIKSVHFVYTCSIFGVYYIGNIVGTVMAVKKKKRDHLNQLDNEILSYYSSLTGAVAN